MAHRSANAEEALARARDHARNAAAEAVAAIRALLEAGSLAALGPGAADQAWLTRALEVLDGLASLLEGERNRSARELLEAVMAAVDEQVAHWEAESRNDPAARSVLRAFLALREILFEFGTRAERAAEPRRATLTRVPLDDADSEPA